MKRNYEIILNKIFVGSYLTYNLGHELINFITDENGQRYVYLNPWGKRNKKAASESKYAFHIIESSTSDEKGVFELVAISEIDGKSDTIYSKDTKNERNNSPKFNNHTFYEIFYCGTESDKAHSYSFKASRVYKPKIRVLIKINREKAILHEKEEGKLIIELTCNPQRNICYANATCGSQKSGLSDLEVLEEFLRDNEKYLEEDNKIFSTDTYDDEQCYAIISGRAKLEVSTSNQIAYFLQRDVRLTYKFLHDFLGISSVGEDERFEIIREKEKNIDILIKNKNHVIVIENKIDSHINSIDSKPNVRTGKYGSQLSKYYLYVEKKYKEIKDKRFFVLAPEYNEITQQELNDHYENGDSYILKTYNDLINLLCDYKDSPLWASSDERKFLFEQFKKSIEYLTWSNAEKHKNVAYIRLKQRLEELDKQESSKQ